MKIVKIRDLKLKNRVFLAPMQQINDIAFRQLCKECGAELVYTGMVNPRSKEKLDLRDKPALQLFCENEQYVSSFIKKYEKKISLFDLNLGCPSPKIVGQGLGSFLLKDEKKVENILKIMRKSTKKPITCKIRKTSNMKLIKVIEKYCDAIAIHPRTSEQGYSGVPDLKFARKIKKLVKIPVIYSGNIESREEAEKLLKEFDFIMIGRKAIGNPSFFSELTDSNIKKTFKDYLVLAKKYKLSFTQIKQQTIFFTKGKQGGAKLREKLNHAKNFKELKEIWKNVK